MEPRRPTTPRRRSGDPIEAVTAALAPVSARPRNAIMSGGQPIQWQRRVMDFDRNGPGVLGYYLDTVALMASLCPLYPEVFTGKGPNGWERSEDPVLQVLIAGWRGQLQSQGDLVYLYVRGRESIGRCWMISDRDTGYNVTLSGTQNGDTFTWTDLWGRQRQTPVGNRVFMSWNPDPYEQWKPFSPVRRAIPDLERLRASVRSQTRTINGRLVLNGMMAFDPGNQEGVEARPYRQPDPDGDGDDLGAMDQIVDDYVRLGKQSARDDNSPAALIPYPYIGKPATYVEIGRDLDPLILEVETMATAAVARAVNFPEQLLTMGPGAANHWNEYLLQESQVKNGLAPKLQPLANELTRWYFRPAVAAMNQHLQGAWMSDPMKVRIAWDMSFLLKRPSMFGDLLSAWQAGAIEREEVARELGVPVMELPDGLSEFEFWELATGSKGAPYTEVDEDGQIVVPDLGGGPGGDAEALPPDGPGALPPGGTPELPAAPTAPGSPTAPTAPVQEPAAPPGVTAAVAVAPYDPNVVYEEASKADLQTEAALSALTAAMVAAAVAELTRRLVTTLPRGSVERQAARGKPFEVLWAEADDAQRQQVGVESVIADVVAQYQPQVEAVIADAHRSFWSKWGPVIGTVAAVLATEAAANHASAMTAWLANRVARGTFKGIKAPLGVVRDAMMVAGGAQVAVGGALMRNAANQPRPSTGGEWVGNTGHLTGHNTITLLPPQFTMHWQHGYFGDPQVPFPPHVELDGREFNRYSDVAPYMPNDHAGCRCMILFRWARGV